MARPTGDRSKTREQIVAAAAAIFAERGFHATSLRELAGSLGLSKAAVHYHFQSKDALLDCLLEPAFRRVDAVLRATPAPPLSDDHRRRLLRDYRHALGQARSAFAVLHDPISSTRPDIQARYQSQRAMLEDMLVGPNPRERARMRARAALFVLESSADSDELAAESVEAALEVLGSVSARPLALVGAQRSRAHADPAEHGSAAS